MRIPDKGEGYDAGRGNQRGSLPPLVLGKGPGELRNGMLYRRLGRTGERVSAIAFGGSHFAKPSLSEAESIRLVHAAIDHGITFMDNCWDYNGGKSESRMGKALAKDGRREKVFLETKIDGRTRAAAEKQIDESLERLKTDRIDLLMHHEILRFDDPHRIFEEGGAQEAVLAAKKAGKVRFVGFTGHKDPQIHLYMLDVAGRHGFTFDAVLMPSNVMDAHFRSFARWVMPRLVTEGIGVMTMKPLGGADAVILKSKVVQAPECLRYALTLAADVVVTGLETDAAIAQAVAVAKTFTPMTEPELAALLARTEEVASSGRFELFKTSPHFDGTATHPDWLGEESDRVRQLAPEGSG